MKKPPDIVYGLEEVPPPVVTMLCGVQHVGLIAINLVYPLLVFRIAGTPANAVVDLIDTGMLVLAAGTVLQALRVGPLGSGFMCPSVFTATYLGPASAAAKLGGLPLVFGMTIFAGFLEAALAPLLNRLRPIFPPEISGLVIFMIGVSASVAGLRLMLGGSAVPVTSAEWSVAAITLATTVILSVWTRGMARMLCALIGVAIGYVAAGIAGTFDPAQGAAVGAAAWVDVPQLGRVSWSFDAGLAVPFAIAALAAAMKALGVITICQRTNDAEWVRPDLSSIKGGVLADGAATVLSGLAGSVGTSTASANVGLAAVTGVSSRRIAYAIAMILVLLAFVPKFAAALASMPRSVMVATLLFSMSSVIVQGIQIMSSRLLDARRSLTIALSIVAGVAVDIFPAIAEAAPPAAGPLVGSALVLATVTALGLNLLFRLGVKKKVGLMITGESTDPETIETFFARSGRAWGARPDVISRAVFGVQQLAETIFENCSPQGPLAIEAAFDEFNLDVRVHYQGEPLELPDARPTDEEIRESADGVRRLAGFLVRRNADRARATLARGRVTIHFHFDH
ncbi:MAG TPA: solute carrier family 23 protein [Burkholderiales bacterium]|nr:solute carrier family 23 protein [Burkholderiales bacterium]